MKKTNTFFKIGVIALVMALIPCKSNAQNSKIMGGAGLSFTSDINSLGIYGKGIYAINDKWEGAGTFTYIFESDFVKWSMLDIDGHYVFNSNNSTLFYGLGGINLTFWKMKMNTLFGSSDISGSEMGLNIGAGCRYMLSDNIHLIGEAKYTLGGFNFLTIGAGVLYNF